NHHPPGQEVAAVVVKQPDPSGGPHREPAPAKVVHELVTGGVSHAAAFDGLPLEPTPRDVGERGGLVEKPGVVQLDRRGETGPFRRPETNHRWTLRYRLDARNFACPRPSPVGQARDGGPEADPLDPLDEVNRVAADRATEAVP